MAKNRERKRLNKLDAMPSSEIREKLSITEGSIKEVRRTISHCCREDEEVIRHKVPKSLGRGRRRLKAALERAEEREKYMNQRQEMGDKRASKRPECIQYTDPDNAFPGEIVASFRGTNVIIRKGQWGAAPLLISIRNERGGFGAQDTADSFEEAVRAAYRIIEKRR